MATSVFNHSDYRSYLTKFIEQNAHTKGLRKSLAQAAGCHATYLSLVLSKKADLSPEQAFKMGVHMGLEAAELDHFVDLVQLERSQDSQFKKHLKARINKRADVELRVSKQMNVPAAEVRSDKNPDYFRDAIHVAVHLCLDLPAMKKSEDIAERLKLPRAAVEKSLQLLQSMGLAATSPRGEWQPGLNTLHFTSGSLEALCHHRNWRDIAVRSYARGAHQDSIHYTSVHCLSMQEYLQLKQDLIDVIKKSRSFIKTQEKQEVLVSFCSDLFLVDML